ncbi:MAG: DUF4438 domain-containing protein [Chloroflexota bacterium]|nr:DUF4438 domain-containing protein [Chloroflexota bacterium]
MSLVTNVDRLVKISVMGQVSAPRYDSRSPYRISHDGQPRVLPGTGGITYDIRVGDRVGGLVGDHVEPCVSLKNPDETANGGLNVLACVGNEAIVTSGAAKGETGVVTGKHGGIEHVMIDFPPETTDKMVVGDSVLVRGFGTGLAIEGFPDVLCTSLDPALLARWVTRVEDGKLVVPVAARAPAAVMGSGLGRDHVFRGDYDITLFDRDVVAEYGLDALRFGDFVAILDADATYGRHYAGGAVSVGIIAHGDSIIAGHGPGVTGLLTSRSGKITPVIDPAANIADVLGLRADAG